MPITTPPRNKPDATPAAPAKTDKFISGAPDGGGKGKGVWKGKKRQISITISPDLLEQIDTLSAEYGQSRAAVIGMAIYQAVRNGLDLKKGEKNG
jgi:hypothetical protein